MAQPFCTGAVHAYADTGAPGSRTPLYLGTTESFPGIDTSRNWDSVMNDISGSKDPLDYIYEGQGQAVISLVLTRFNQNVLNAIRQVPGPGNTLGLDTLATVGSLAGFEGWAFRFWLLYSFGSAGFGAKAAFSTMEPGKYYPQTILWGPERTEGGTRAKKEHLILMAWKKYNPQTGTFQLFSEASGDFAGLPAPD